jgi:hypothetical protein
MIPAQTQKQLDDLARKYGNELYGRVKTVLASPKFRNTGELEESLKLIITPATDKDAPVIILEYADQGYYLNYKSPSWVKQPNVEKLLKWAETKTFTSIPGYKGTPNIPEYKQKERIAFAIAMDKRKNDTWKPKRWKKEAGLGELLKNINVEVLEAYRTDIEKILANSIATGSVLS